MNKKGETIVVDDATPILLKFIHLAMRIIINESLLKEKNKTSETHFGRREWRGGGGFPVPYDARYEVTLELPCLGARSKGS